jgi:hypothetical protein
LACVVVVDAQGVKHLELPVIIVVVQGSLILLLAPVHISSLGRKPGTVGSNKDHAGANDDEQGLQSLVVAQGLGGQTLHRLSVVFPSAPGPGNVGVVHGAENTAENHFLSLVEVNQAILACWWPTLVQS